MVPKDPKARRFGLRDKLATINSLEMGKADQLVDSWPYSLKWGKWAQHRDKKGEQKVEGLCKGRV